MPPKCLPTLADPIHHTRESSARVTNNLPRLSAPSFFIFFFLPCFVGTMHDENTQGAAGPDSSPLTGRSRLSVQTRADTPSLGVELCCSNNAAKGPALNSDGALCRELERKEKKKIKSQRQQTSSHSRDCGQRGQDFLKQIEMYL